MSFARRGWLLLPALVIALACSGGAQPTPSRSAAPQVTPPPLPTLDPSRSDSGVYARVALDNDRRADRNSVYDIYGVEADGSECSGSFDEPDYTVVAYDDDAADGYVRRLGITVAAADIPDSDGEKTHVTNGGVSFDFTSETGFGTTYSGNSTRENEGSSTIDVTRSGEGLIFDYSGVTYDAVTFAGQLICTTSD